MGVSAPEVFNIWSPVGDDTSQTQPLPKRVFAAAVICGWGPQNDFTELTDML